MSFHFLSATRMKQEQNTNAFKNDIENFNIIFAS